MFGDYEFKVLRSKLSNEAVEEIQAFCEELAQINDDDYNLNILLTFFNEVKLYDLRKRLGEDYQGIDDLVRRLEGKYEWVKVVKKNGDAYSVLLLDGKESSP